ncbi:MerR family transcriptional regulator [Roseovarius sp. C7]|uniref:MerR family transcriptional regulator n=1 Tax=Roseovarius sp. C7 TaxID=3398643 RepID=UPI0039F56E6C
MPKSADAFRTISEVADWLGVPAHVLRFWESKFSQVKPVKRAGGRRYYRPADMRLLGGIRKLLHDDGMTIKGVQKLLREQGIKHVAALSLPLDTDDDAIPLAASTAAEPETATVLSFSRDEAEDAAIEAAQPAASEPAPEAKAPTPEPEPAPDEDRTAHAPADPGTAEEAPATPASTEPAPTEPAPADATSTDTQPASQPEPITEAEPEQGPSQEQTEDAAQAPPTTNGTPAPHSADPAPESAPKPSIPRPRQITLPDDPADTLAAAPGPLSKLAALDPAVPTGQNSDWTALFDRVRRFPTAKVKSNK